MLTLYHNPRCSKSRACLQILQEQHSPFKIINYPKEGLKMSELMLLEKCLGLNEIIRQNEPIYKELNLAKAPNEVVLAAIIEHPELLQRPILILDDRAIIARPPEKALEFIHD